MFVFQSDLGPGELAFSPSNFSPATISNFTSQDSIGVPLQTSWTFWIDKYVKHLGFLKGIVS
jgi:hypothetical protein